VDVPDVGVDGIGTAAGVVTFRDGDQVLCDAVPVSLGAAACVTTDLAAGHPAITATFYPAIGTSVDTSSSPVLQILVGTSPGIMGPGKTTVRVGRATTIRLRGTGQPTPSLALVKGTLPPGLKLTKKAGQVTITGKPKASGVGRHALTFRATNQMGVASHALTIVVKRG
jgi:hypothetical protein